ncbi:MAG: branched-chain amino acid ABC transporter permease [Micromonosporaceae bacterium]
MRALGPAAVVVALAAAPFVVTSYVISLATGVLVLGLLAMSVNLLTGVAGLPTLGQAAYFGVGAYATALVARSWSQVGVVHLVVAAAAGAAVAALTGLVVVRTRGVVFLMLTLAISELTYSAVLEWDAVTGGSDGRATPAVSPIWGMAPLRRDGLVYLWVLAVFLLLFALVAAVVRSPFGLALRGIRDNEARMRADGYPVNRYLLVGYTFAGGLAGAAGALWISAQRFVSPSDIGFHVSAMALIAVVLGGLGSMWGAVAGMGLVVLTRDLVGSQLTGDLAGRGVLLLGLVFVAAVYLMPRGLAGLRGWYDRRRHRHARAVH